MAFLSPFFLYFLPLCLLPILWHLIRQKDIHREKIASLYFIEKIYGTRSRKLLFSNWLELLLEVLFIALLCLSFAKPYLQNKDQHVKDIYFILDNSPSSFNALKKKITGDHLLDELWDKLDNNKIFFCDFSMITENLPPKKVFDKKEFKKNIISMTVATSQMDIGEFDRYVVNWMGPTMGENTFILISDLKENHFNQASSLDALKIYYYDIHPYLDNVHFSISSPSPKLEFINTPTHLKLTLESSKSPKNVSLEIVEGKKSLFLEEIILSSGREQILLPIRFEQSGHHHLQIKMTYQNQVTKKEITREDFATLYVTSPLEIYIQSTDKYLSLFEKMFSFDIEKSQIKLIKKKPSQKDRKPDIAMVTSYKDPVELSWLNEIPTILFIPKEAELKKLNNFLRYELSMDVNLIERFWNEEKKDINVNKGFVGPFKLLEDVVDLDKIALDGEVSIQSYNLPVINRKTGGGFLTLGEKVVLYGFDAESKKSQFLPSITGLSFIYQSILYLLRDFDIENKFGREHLTNESFIPILLTEKDPFNQDGGIYSNENMFISVHPKIEEWNSKPANLKKVFRSAISLNNQSAQVIKNDYFIAKWLLVLAIFCLVLLTALFYFRYRLS